MKSIYIILIIFSFSVNASVQLRIDELGDRVINILEETPGEEMLNEENGMVLVELNALLQNQVIDEIEADAAFHEIDRDEYIDSIISMEDFLIDTRNRYSKREEMKDSEKFIFFVKTGIRLQIQNQIRFIPDGYFEKEEEIKEMMLQMTIDLGIQI